MHAKPLQNTTRVCLLVQPKPRMFPTPSILSGLLALQGDIEPAENHGCDFLRMASQDLDGMSGLVPGSEINRVLAHSKIPVLVYR